MAVYEVLAEDKKTVTNRIIFDGEDTSFLDLECGKGRWRLEQPKTPDPVPLTKLDINKMCESIILSRLDNHTQINLVASRPTMTPEEAVQYDVVFKWVGRMREKARKYKSAKKPIYNNQELAWPPVPNEVEILSKKY